MRFLSILFLFFISIISSYSLSDVYAQRIYRDIVVANGISHAPALIFSGSSDIDARYENNGPIVITEGMLRFVHNKDELAHILGHELAHFTTYHIGSDEWFNEYGADLLGAFYMQRAGYNKCVGVQALKRVPWDKSHPNPLDRIK